MHIPSAHAELDITVLQQFIRDNPLGILTTALQSSSFPFIQSSHIPFVIDGPGVDSDSKFGRLRGHLARQNPQAKAMVESLEARNRTGPETLELEDEVLILFNGPYQHYVTPKFYTETKPSTGKVVPTWDYSAVQVYGKAIIYYNTKSEEAGAFLDKQLYDLSQQCETTIMGYTGGDKPSPWRVSDAPDQYIDLRKKNILGIEIQIQQLEGRFKMSQDKRPGDRAGVIQGFKNLGTDVGHGIAAMVKERSDLKDLLKE
jgi:transcriptional regulator